MTTKAADWTPEGEPDPLMVFYEARADTRKGRYEEALAKRLWFHKHALDTKPELTGVRLSYALQDWLELGEVYPPALTALEELHAECRASLEAGTGTRDIFHDYASFNRAIGKESDTAGMFRVLSERYPRLASVVFDMALPSLVRARAYELCNRFLRPARDLRRMRKLFRIQMNFAADPTLGGQINLSSAPDPSVGEQLKFFGEQKFSNDARLLVALLVVNGRQAEAVRVARVAKRVWWDAEFHHLIEQALQGEVPEPWP